MIQPLRIRPLPVRNILERLLEKMQELLSRCGLKMENMRLLILEENDQRYCKSQVTETIEF